MIKMMLDWIMKDGYSRLKEEAQHQKEWRGDVRRSNVSEAENWKKRFVS